MMNLSGIANALGQAAVAVGRSVELSMLLKATMVMLLGLAAVRLARNARASVRHVVLSATFASLFLLPLAILSGPTVAIGVPIASTGPTVEATGSSLRLVDGPPLPAPERAAAVAVSRSPATIPSVLRALYASGALLLLISLGTAIWRLSRIRRDGLPWLEARPFVRALGDEAGVRKPVDLLLHDDVVAPLTCGIRRSAIILPMDARGWNDVDLKRALVHELEHVRRADWPVQLAARVVCAAYWFHPLVWVAWRQLCLEAERAADDAVLHRAERTEYAEQLVLLARRLATAPARSALGMANRSHLAERISAILEPGLRRGRVSLTVTACAMAAAVLVATAIAPVNAVAVGASAASPSSVSAAESPVGLVPQRRASPLDRALLEAAEEGKLEEVVETLGAGANVNAAIDGDGTPLIAAARKGQLKVATLLVDRGADINMGVSGDGNPLIMAAGAGHLAVVAFLLERGANIEQVVPGDENALIAASGHGHLQVVQQLVAWRANVNARVWAPEGLSGDSGEWRTPLSMARRGGHDEVVKFLLVSGARQ